MDFDKALRKQKLNFRLFLLTMGFIFLFNPVALIITEVNQLNYIMLLFIIEGLIVVSIILKYKMLHLKFTPLMDSIKIESSFPSKKIEIPYDKIVGVAVDNVTLDIKLIIIVSMFKRGKLFKNIKIEKLKEGTFFYDLINRIIAIRKKKNLQYIIVSTGGVKKYKLLDILYQRCTRAVFTSDAILEIKKYRE